jgi:hypothetical protein
MFECNFFPKSSIVHFGGTNGSAAMFECEYEIGFVMLMLVQSENANMKK